MMENFHEVEEKAIAFLNNLSSGKCIITLAFWEEFAELLVNKGSMNKEQAMRFLQGSSSEILEIVGRFIEREMKKNVYIQSNT